MAKPKAIVDAWMPGALASKDACYAALAARDRRYDGAIFVGVLSTRIYCRPVCPARTPRQANCTFFPRAALAERAGFRPCLRCRPEVAPRCIDQLLGDSLAHRAALQLEQSAHRLEDKAVESVAARLGCTSRHLRRVVVAALGVTPMELVQTARLLTAKRLLTESALSIVDVAFASGFGSTRRMNDLFRRRYRMTPSELRSAPRALEASSGRDAQPFGGTRFHLAYRPPLAWNALLVHLSHRAIPGVEMVTFDEPSGDGRTRASSYPSAAIETGNGPQPKPISYRRVVSVVGAAPRDRLTGWIDVQNDESQCRLTVTVSDALVQHAPSLLPRIRALFDLDASPVAIDAHLARDPRLAPLVARCPGLRVPGSFDGFELAWRTIVGQQISVKSATTVAGAIAATAGVVVETPWPELRLASPTAASLARLSERDYRNAGLIPPRIEAIRALATLIHRDNMVFESGVDPALTARNLLAIRGIGPWTVSYLLMRALRRPDAFPYDDLVLRRALTSTRRADAERETTPWSPWRAYAAMHLWRSAGSTSPPSASESSHERGRGHRARRAPEHTIKRVTKRTT